MSAKSRVEYFNNIKVVEDLLKNFGVLYNAHSTFFVCTSSIICQIRFPSFAPVSKENPTWQVNYNSTKLSK